MEITTFKRYWFKEKTKLQISVNMILRRAPF